MSAFLLPALFFRGLRHPTGGAQDFLGRGFAGEHFCDTVVHESLHALFDCQAAEHGRVGMLGAA